MDFEFQLVAGQLAEEGPRGLQEVGPAAVEFLADENNRPKRIKTRAGITRSHETRPAFSARRR